MFLYNYYSYFSNENSSLEITVQSYKLTKCIQTLVSQSQSLFNNKDKLGGKKTLEYCSLIGMFLHNGVL